jgi:hypothetical protein
MIEKKLEYLFMSPDELSPHTGVISPLQYKLKLIITLCQFDD